jgi:hypothetical protein
VVHLHDIIVATMFYLLPELHQRLQSRRCRLTRRRCAPGAIAAAPFIARQYVSRTKFLPFSVDWSSYLLLLDRFGSLTFVRRTFL